MLRKDTQMVERIRRCGEGVEEGEAQLMTQLKVVGPDQRRLHARAGSPIRNPWVS